MKIATRPTMKNRRLLDCGICAFAAVFALSFPAAAKNWRCVCTLEAENPNFKWLTFTHSFDDFDLNGYSGSDEEMAQKKCADALSEAHGQFGLATLLKLREDKLLSGQKVAFRKDRSTLCQSSSEDQQKTFNDTNVWLTCRVHDADLGKKDISSGIKVRSGHQVGSAITCGGNY